MKAVAAFARKNAMFFVSKCAVIQLTAVTNSMRQNQHVLLCPLLDRLNAHVLWGKWVFVFQMLVMLSTLKCFLK